MANLQKKIIVNEVYGSAASGKPDVRLGFRVIEAFNTIRYKIGQDIHPVEVEELLERGIMSVVTRDKIYSDTVIPHPNSK